MVEIRKGGLHMAPKVAPAPKSATEHIIFSVLTLVKVVSLSPLLGELVSWSGALDGWPEVDGWPEDVVPNSATGGLECPLVATGDWSGMSFAIPMGVMEDMDEFVPEVREVSNLFHEEHIHDNMQSKSIKKNMCFLLNYKSECMIIKGIIFMAVWQASQMPNLWHALKQDQLQQWEHSP